MLYDFISNLQNKPESTKHRFLWFVIFIVFAALVTLWFFTTKDRIATKNLFTLPTQEVASHANLDDKQNLPNGPIESLWKGTTITLAQLTDQIENLLSRSSQILNPTIQNPIEPRQKSIHRLPIK